MNVMVAASDLPWQELHGNLRAFVARRVRNQADVDDLVQRVLLRLLTGVGSLRDADRLHAWVYRTARNVIIDHYRSSGATREVASGDAADLAAEGPEAAPDDEEAALKELAVCLTPMVRQLPAAYREAVTLTDLEGVTQVEAARRLGLSVSGMKSRVQRGRKQLRAVLEACCRVDLDNQGAITAYQTRRADSCSPGCGTCD